MNTQRLLAITLLLLPAVAGCGAKQFGKTFHNMTRQHITPSNGGTPLRRKYNQLTKGMTEAQVMALMGPPVRKSERERNGFHFTVCTYVEGDWRAVIVIGAHGMDVAHSSDDPDFGK